MCERYVLPEQAAAEREFVPARAWWKFSPRYNVAAQQYVPAIQWHDGQSEAIMMRWGLIPSWAEGKPLAAPPHAIGSDRIERSDLHRLPWLNGQRCILPVAGFYLWRLTSAKYRQPYFVRLIDRAVFAFAAIWDRSGADEDVVESCSVITVPANDLMARIAGAALAMPAILKRRDYATWLHGTPLEARATLQPYGSEGMEAYAVSPRINSTVADDAGLIRPAQRVKIVGSAAVHAFSGSANPANLPG